LKPTFPVRGKLLSVLALVICLASGAVGLTDRDEDQAFRQESSSRKAIEAQGQRGVALSAREPNRLRSGISTQKKSSKALSPQRAASAALRTAGFLYIPSSTHCGAAQVFTGFGRSPPSLSL
jgi:hypothetical protein